MYDDESDTLETAQQRKLEYHIQQARADGAARVLDIGCGWGALQKQLGQEHQVKVAVRPCAGRTIQSIRSAPLSISRDFVTVRSE